MPLIYRIKCTACGKGPAFKSFVAGWVATDGKKEGALLPDGYMALKLDTGEFVCLPHPLESSTLKSHGLTWNQAAKQNRLYRVTFKICTTCGLINEAPVIMNQPLGCGVGMATVIVAIILFRFVINLNWPLTLLLGGLICFAAYILTDWINRVREEKSDPNLSLKACFGCSGVHFVTIPSAKGKLMPCPLCKAQAMKYTAAGIS